MFEEPDLVELLKDWEGKPTKAFLSWICEEWGKDLLIVTSLQTQSLPLLHMLSEVSPGSEVTFVDTGFHFSETIEFKETLEQILELRIKVLTSEGGNSAPSLWSVSPSRCCQENKVAPFERALSNSLAWLTGIRRDQTQFRKNIQLVQRDERGLLKFCPMAFWTAEEISSYIKREKLPRHPLDSRGYTSIGCRPCTSVPKPGGDLRGGRWAGREKTECGLHRGSEQIIAQSNTELDK